MIPPHLAYKIRCEGLTKSFGNVHAVSNVSVEFSSSTVAAIVGPNGAGKTTLLHLLTGFLRAESGRILVNTRDVTNLPPHEFVGCGVVRTFQEQRLIQHMTVIENVMLAEPRAKDENFLAALFQWGATGRERKSRDCALNLLAFVGLQGQSEALAGELSYGQQKLLSLACCIATGGNILLLDEPVAGVDPVIMKLILGLIKRLKAQGKLIVFIEHDLAVVRELADVVIVMDEGRVLLQGSPSDVFATPEIAAAYLD